MQDPSIEVRERGGQRPGRGRGPGWEDMMYLHFVAVKRKRKKRERTWRNFRFQSRLALRKCVQNSLHIHA